MRGRDQNRPCECGSGQKAKKCCHPKHEVDTRSVREKVVAALKAKRDRADAVARGEVPKA